MLLRNQLGISPETKVILTVSGSQGYKNIGSILRALDILRRRSDARIQFLRAGADFSPEQNRLIKDLELREFVQFVGSPQSDQELAQLYQAADIFAFPSSYEGFGWPPLEAMRCGIPVVASNAGSLPEVLGDTALLVNPQDSGGLALAVERILKNPLLRNEMVGRGLKLAASYSWARTAQQTAGVYERVIRESASNHCIESHASTQSYLRQQR